LSTKVPTADAPRRLRRTDALTPGRERRIVFFSPQLNIAMRFRELIEEIQPGGTFYHVTTDNRLKSIMTTGLEPRRHRRWHNQLGGILGDRGVIYLISDFTEAVRFAARWDWQMRMHKKQMKTVILVLKNVPTAGLEPDNHIEGQLAGHTWYKSPAIIPPQDIVRVIPLTPELTKQVVAGGATEPDEEPVQQAPNQPPPAF